MSQTPSDKPTTSPAAAEFDRPLLLTAGQDLRGYVTGLVGRTVLTVISCLTILAVLLIFAFIAYESIGFIREKGLGVLFASDDWDPTHEPKGFGALGMFYGSAMVTLGAMVIAAPLGLLAAVFLSDVVPFAVRNAVKPVVEILAAIPSVAFGFFAIRVLSPWLMDAMGMDSGRNMLNASLILAVMAVPTIVSISEDSLTAIGRELREGAYALGATRAEVLVKVVIPAGHSGIIAAVVLGIMRAVGETMLVWMAAGNQTAIPAEWWNLGAGIRTLTANIAAEMGEAEQGGLHYRALFTLGLLLLLITFALNLISEYFLRQAKRAAGGGTK